MFFHTHTLLDIKTKRSLQTVEDFEILTKVSVMKIFKIKIKLNVRT